MDKQEMVNLTAELLMELPYEKVEFICRMIFRVADNLGIAKGVQNDTEKEG